MKYMDVRFRSLIVPPLLVALSGCGTTVFLDKINGSAFGQPPAPPATGTSEVGAGAMVATDPLNDSTDRWLLLSRNGPLSDSGRYTATFAQNVTQKKVSVDLVAFVPRNTPAMMTVFFEPGPPAPPDPLMHIDLLTDGRIRFNDTLFDGTFAFDHLIGFFITFDLAASPPSATILIRGGATDASLTVPVPVHAANRGLGRVRLLVPFEGVDAPNGSFLINDVIATTPN